MEHREEAASRASMLRCIALFKLLKATLLLIFAGTEIHLLHHDRMQPVIHLTHILHVDPENRYLHGFLTWLLNVDEKKLWLLSVGTILYSLLFSVEGIGLWLGRAWAELLTILSTAGLLPLEIYELIKKTSVTKSAVLSLNILIVLYLLRRVRCRSRLAH